MLLISIAFLVSFAFGFILLEGSTKHEGYGFFFEEGEYDKFRECDSAELIINSSEFLRGI